MSDIPNNTLLDIDHIASELQDGLKELLNAPISLSKCREIVVRTFDDLVPSRLEWSSIVTDTRTEFTKNYILSLGVSINVDAVSQLSYLLRTIDRMVLNELTIVVPFPTWSYIFIQGIGSTVRIEVTGDHRIDEWRVLTNDGGISYDEVIARFTKELEDRVFNSIDGIVPFEMEDLVRKLLTTPKRQR